MPADSAAAAYSAEFAVTCVNLRKPFPFRIPPTVTVQFAGWAVQV